MNIAYIDGENTKGRIREVFTTLHFPLPAWEQYHFKGLFDEAFQVEPVTERRFYRALPKPHPDLPKEAEGLLQSYRNLGGHLARQNFTVIRGGTLRADYRQPGDPRPKYREKGVDVSLAVDMVADVYDETVEKCFLVASDSDYQPAVSKVRGRGKAVVYVGFEVNPNLGLIAKTNARIIISNASVLRHGGITLP